MLPGFSGLCSDRIALPALMRRSFKRLTEAVGLKIRLNLLITAALVISVVVGGKLAIHNYRRAVSRETEASAQLVLGLLRATRDLSLPPVEASQFREHLSRAFRALTLVRHVRLELIDTAGHVLSRSPVPFSSAARSAPRWFVRLVAPPRRIYRVPISLGAGVTGFVVVSTDPDDEVAEEWANTRDLLAVVALLFLALWILLVWYIGHALRPMDTLRAAFEALGRGDLSARAAVFGGSELARINRKFNEMADALELASGENRHLTQRLIDLRDEERRAIARDLHDNLAQYLFAIRTDSFAIERLATAATTPQLGEAARSISESASRMEGIVRDLIQRLRPLVLDELGLKDALRDLVATWRTRNPRIVCSLQIDAHLGVGPKEVELAVYHIVQESLTNVAKHSDASVAAVAVRKANASAAAEPQPGEHRDGLSLEVVVEDDGRSGHAVTGAGVGLVGMRERVETLGGRLETAYQSGLGWRVSARIPLTERGRAGAV
jgi:two-component system, NarL family, sensor histidine kinase UhpB